MSSLRVHHEDEETPLLLLKSSERSGIQPCYGSPSSSSLRRLHSTSSSTSISFSLRIVTNTAALLSTFCFSGIIFGWAPMKLILQREGQYDELNNPVATLQQFNRIFTIAQFVLSFASLPIGFLLDSSSKTVHFGLAATFEISGLILFGISDSKTKHGDYFILAYSLLALGGCMTMLGSFPASFLLPRHQAGILAAVSCLFDASSILFAIFDRCNATQPHNWTRQHLFTTYAILAIVIYTILSCCWAILERSNWKSVAETEAQHHQQRKNQNQRQEKEKTNIVVDAHAERIHRLGIHEWTLRQQLGTLEFVTVLMFACVHMLRCNYYIETVNEVLATYGDADSKFARIFSFALPSGIIFVPVIERTIQYWGVVNTLHITNGIGVVFGSLLLIPSLRLQAVNFVVFTAFRAFLYATLNTFIAVSFGVSTMGRVIGCTFTSAAVVTLLQYPAAVFAERHGSFTMVNLILLLACVLPISLGCWYSHCIHRHHDHCTMVNT